MINSYGCFSAYHVVLADGLPYWQLFMHRALSVNKSSQLKSLDLSCGKLWKPLMDISSHSLAIEKTVPKF